MLGESKETPQQAPLQSLEEARAKLQQVSRRFNEATVSAPWSAEAAILRVELLDAAERVKSLEATAREEARAQAAALEREDGELRRELVSTCEGAITEASKAASELWAAHRKIASLVGQRDELRARIAGLRGEPEQWWLRGDTLGFVFPQVPGSGAGELQLAEMLGTVGVDVIELARRRRG